MRISVKGGVWKNTEDEILKAAVMKYGKNQWARISSLLTRKSPKQCKARWFEWLDPSVKKTEWSRDEDEKLLHLAKIMPTQWRTISPIVGRTPAQCLERYQKLLDEAEAGGLLGEGPVEANKEDVRRLRPGEIDPDPETRPARPDPVDMDEDEKEMLSEARARLANTQGKKAKRKAREKQLESARRLAAHQKRRELKAAGIEINERKKGRGIDYNVDIPFQHVPPPGFWDITSEVERERSSKKSMTNILLSKLEGQRRSEIEEEARRKDEEKIKAKAESGHYIPRSAMKVLEQPSFTERNKLNLPAPQVTIDEMNAIVKMSNTSNMVTNPPDGNASMPTLLLLSDYNLASDISGTIQTQPTHTPFTSESSIRTQARNLKALVESQTALLGKEIETVGDIDFKTPLSKGASITRPNVDLTEENGNNTSVSESIQVRSTPLRDKMGINQLNSDISTPMSSDRYGRTSSRYSIGGSSSVSFSQKKYVSELFKSLPAPQNDFEIILPEPEPENVEDDGISNGDVNVGARGGVARNSAKKPDDKSKYLDLSSQAVLRNLPRPIVVDSDLILGRSESKTETAVQLQNDGVQQVKSKKEKKTQSRCKTSTSKTQARTNDDVTYDAATIDKLIRSTVHDMLLSDAYYHTAPYQKEIPPSSAVSALDTYAFSPEEMKNVNDLIEEECCLMKKSDKRTFLYDANELEKIRSSVSSTYIENPSCDKRMLVKLADIDDKEKIKIHRASLLHYRRLAKEGALASRKMESKLVVLLSGLQMRSKKLMNSILELWQKCDNAARTRDSFLHIQKIEDANAGHRISSNKEMRMKFYSN